LPRTPVVAIVEDNEAVREALSDLLQVLNFSSRAFDRAEAFLAEFAPGRFDCLITDIRMPGVDGLELQRRLRALASSMPVIFVTSDGDPATKERALDEGAHAVLAKPVSDDDLIRCLKTALSRTFTGDSDDGEENGE